jgi:stress response protein SCP2
MNLKNISKFNKKNNKFMIFYKKTKNPNIKIVHVLDKKTNKSTTNYVKDENLEKFISYLTSNGYTGLW